MKITVTITVDDISRTEAFESHPEVWERDLHNDVHTSASVLLDTIAKDKIKITLMRTDELTYAQTLDEMYIEFGNPLVNEALKELEL